VVNVRALDRLVAKQVIEDFDYKYLNVDVREFQSVIPTSENILRVIEDRLAACWQSVFPGERPRLESIRLRETRRNLFELKAS
jgi:6-pyruvoyl-tetrahydropterin synthase